MPTRGLFVTGTDTGVGKTVVSAALMHRYRLAMTLRYWKPIQTGIEQDDDTAEVERLGACQAGELERTGIRLPHPVSPHLAARWHGTAIALPPLIEPILRPHADPLDGIGDRVSDTIRWIVEGAGGVLVPINEHETMVDLMTALGLPVLVVARSALGTINHTLLSLEALRRRRLRVAGVVMVGDRNRENLGAIERYGGVEVLGEMPRLDSLDPAGLSSWATSELDADGRLLEWLQ